MAQMMKRSRTALWLAGLLALVQLSAEANTLVNVRVTVLSPPCVINGGQPIEVNFGDEVMTTRIDGSNYRRPVNYTLTCNGQSSNALKLQVQGRRPVSTVNCCAPARTDWASRCFTGRPLANQSVVEFCLSRHADA